MAEPVTFTITQDNAECDDCHAHFAPNKDGMYEISPHLRDAHGFRGQIKFETISEVICPRRVNVRAMEAA